MKLFKSKKILAVASICAMFLSISASAQTYVRYVVPSDLGTKTLFSDSVLSSITLPHGVSRLDNSLAIQEAAFELVDLLRDKDIKLLSVYVCGSTSPDGLWQENVALSKARTDAAVNYLRYVTGVPVDKIYQESLNEDWDRLYELVEESDMPYKAEVLDIIKTETWSARKQALMKLDGGKAWRILLDDFFPHLRCVRIAFYCLWDPSKPYLTCPDVAKMKADRIRETKVDTVYVRDTVYYKHETVYLPQEPEPVPEVVEEVVLPLEEPVTVQPKEPVPWMFGVKTNLLYDAILIPTIGVEMQIARHLSLDLQGFYGFCNIFNMKDRTTKIYGFSPEVRLWFGEKAMRKGSFVGVHANLAWYTLQWTDGLLYQNGLERLDGNYFDAGNTNPAWSMGLTYGYSIGFGKKKNWGLELVLGLGYANYKQNVAEHFGDVWQFLEHQDKHYLGITKAGLNLTYRFPLRKEK